LARKVWHNAVHERDESKECESLKRCFHFLNKTSRSFAAVILELHPELLVPVTLFYLVLRGLDTIEDDMTIPLEKKEPLLRNFQDILDKDGWNFTENGPNEKDRQLLVEFNVVIEEFKKIKPVYQDIIKDITKRMGNGMADYANNAEFNAGVKTIKEYELYCHYVAGLVGEGCTRLFVEAGLANAALLKRPELMESMGQFLQQVNITRDIKEDIDDGRRFWPKEIWSKHVNEFEDLFKPENKQKALNCSSEMILTALTRADDCLYYLAGLREQSVFNFCAIPQTMAIATLETCFQNYALFQKNVKITKGEACQLMVESTQNLQLVCEVFRRYARKIAKKNNPHDPNFLKISITLGRVSHIDPVEAAVANHVRLSNSSSQYSRRNNHQSTRRHLPPSRRRSGNGKRTLRPTGTWSTLSPPLLVQFWSSHSSWYVSQLRYFQRPLTKFSSLSPGSRVRASTLPTLNLSWSLAS
jgi:farnesyl-diphosphate farnesyltransferase